MYSYKPSLYCSNQYLPDLRHLLFFAGTSGCGAGNVSGIAAVVFCWLCRLCFRFCTFRGLFWYSCLSRVYRNFRFSFLPVFSVVSSPAGPSGLLSFFCLCCGFLCCGFFCCSLFYSCFLPQFQVQSLVQKLLPFSVLRLFSSFTGSVASAASSFSGSVGSAPICCICYIFLHGN